MSRRALHLLRGWQRRSFPVSLGSQHCQHSREHSATNGRVGWPQDGSFWISRLAAAAEIARSHWCRAECSVMPPRQVLLRENTIKLFVVVILIICCTLVIRFHQASLLWKWRWQHSNMERAHGWSTAAPFMQCKFSSVTECACGIVFFSCTANFLM